MSLDLDVMHPDDTSGHFVLRADLDTEGRQLVVLSGVARSEWGTDGEDTHHATCRLALHETADHLEQSTVHVGLASVGNEDTRFTFATDSARLDTDPTGQLILVVDLALRGHSTLNRFSYQIILTKKTVTTGVEGTVSWPTALFTPATGDVAAVNSRLSVVADARTVTQSTGPFGGEIEHLEHLVDGTVDALDIADDTCHAHYVVSGIPTGRELKIVVTAHGFAATEPGFAATVPGNDILTLTVAAPVRTGVDFHAVPGLALG